MSQDFTFLLLPGFPPSAFVLAVEALRIANRFEPSYYRWKIVSLDGNAVESCSGMSISADEAIGPVAPGTTVIIVAGYDPLICYTDTLQQWLRRLAFQKITLGAIDTGVFPLARAGVLSGYRVTLHWEALEAFKESFPDISTSPELFEIDRDRITCAGGTATIDMMLHLIGINHGSKLAVRVSEQLVMDLIRVAHTPQRTQLVGRYGTNNKKLIKVIDAMGNNIEVPKDNRELAALIGVTPRQLERLFKTHLETTPNRFYLGIRLDRAQQLLRQTDLSIAEISLACGFDSPSYFARRYSANFGCPPSQDRAFPNQANEHVQAHPPTSA